VHADTVVENGFVNKLHRSGRAFTVTEAENHSRCHRLVSEPGEYRDSDFVDCLFRKRDGRAAELSVVASPSVPTNSEKLCHYTLSDEDVFAPTPQMLTATFEVELLSDRRGALFERITYRRRSIAHDGFVPTMRFVRLSGDGGPSAGSPARLLLDRTVVVQAAVVQAAVVQADRILS
jgi:hypothetical protein